MGNKSVNVIVTDVETQQAEIEIVFESTEDEKKCKKREKEKIKLVQAVTSGDFSTLTSKVAGILNIYPQARNSDIILSLKLWETFQPEIYNEQGIKPVDLFKLERMTYITR